VVAVLRRPVTYGGQAPAQSSLEMGSFLCLSDTVYRPARANV
jgi:hypothetical protein